MNNMGAGIVVRYWPTPSSASWITWIRTALHPRGRATWRTYYLGKEEEQMSKYRRVKLIDETPVPVQKSRLFKTKDGKPVGSIEPRASSGNLSGLGWWLDKREYDWEIVMDEYDELVLIAIRR